jgi:proline iminopeptidase
MSPTERRTFYPPIQPYNTGRLRVSAVHEVYFEESGNPKGKPVVFVHGGPGGGTDPKQRRFFDPSSSASSAAGPEGRCRAPASA